MSEVSPATRKVSIFDESLSNTSAGSCHLMMQLAGNHFSYCVIDTSRNKFIALCDYRLSLPLQGEEIQSLFGFDELPFEKSALKKSISVHSMKSALVPQSLFKKEDAAKILALTSPIDDNDLLFADHLKYTDTVHIYSINKGIMDAIQELSGSVNIIHTGTSLIESELLRNKNETIRSMAVNVRQHDLEIVITSGGNLIYYNSFAYQNSEDFIYYLLFVMEQLKLNPEKTPLRFTGEIEKTSASFMISSKYIRNISFGELPDAFEFSYGFRDVSPHAYHSLFNQYLCVS